MRTRDPDRAEGPALEASPSSAWGQGTNGKVRRDGSVSSRHQSGVFLSFRATGYCRNGSDCADRLPHVKESRHLQNILHGLHIKPF